MNQKKPTAKELLAAYIHKNKQLKEAGEKRLESKGWDARDCINELANAIGFHTDAIWIILKYLADKEAEADRAAIFGKNEARLWTAKEAATACGCKSEITILRAFRKGKLQGYRLNSRVIRFKPADVIAWAESKPVIRPSNENKNN